MTHTYEITGMTCTGCVAKVKSELLKLSDVTNAEVQLTSPQATIGMSKHIVVSDLQAAVHKAGNYTITALDTPMQHSINDSAEAATTNNYFPFFLIFTYITGTSLLVQLAKENFDRMQWMSHFMAGFFLVFSFFKLMNLKGFAESYRMYDIVAKVIPGYAYVYPFIELAFGIAFLVGFNPIITNAATLIVMSLSVIGVIQNLLKKSPFQCACLGLIIKLPLSKVTLFEDLLMIVMSATMLIAMLG